jgi:hypothetical protein
LGIEIPGLWITGPQARKKRCPTTSTGAKELGTPKRKQTNNNNATTTTTPSPAGFLPATSKAVPHNFLLLRHPLSSPETLFTGTGPVLLNTPAMWQVQTGRYGALLSHGI